MVDLPPAYLHRMQRLLADGYTEFLSSYDEPPAVGLRVNSLKLTAEKFKALSPYKLSPIPWAEMGFLVPPNERPGKHPYFAAGLYYVQDPSAMAVVELLQPQPGERILDLAAAPGGKTTHIAARMAGRGLLVANDIGQRRARYLVNNLERWGACNVVITNESSTRLAGHFGQYFDRVLVDAPCSGEGMFRKEPVSRGKWTPKEVQRYASLQNTILRDAALLVRSGGLLVYATCTFAPQENEGTIARFIKAHPDFEVVGTSSFPGMAPGRPDWLLDDERVPNLDLTVRIWPHQAPGEGHFIAVLRQKGGGNQPRNEYPGQLAGLPSDISHLYQTFCDDYLINPPHLQNLALKGSKLYMLPALMPDLQGLRVFHWGWWLGTGKKKRFEPSYALAMGLEAEDVRHQVPFTADDPRAKAYLHGQVLPSPGPDGWVVVTVDGYPMGWAKRVQGKIKSHSPRWLRWV
jgi:NOL1/NOP2/sun family putative RNA methylase